MAKTEKELQDLKEKVEELNKELNELSEEELKHVSGGSCNLYTVPRKQSLSTVLAE